jgi:hypothetical protein
MSWRFISDERAKELTATHFELWNFFHKTHNLILTESEITDIIELVKRNIEKEENNV